MSRVLDYAIDTGMVCPGCRGLLEPANEEVLVCGHCVRRYPTVAGLPDLRLASDRYLTLVAERAKAERLAAIEHHSDVMGLAQAYYDVTDDVVDHRRDRFLRHIAGGLERGRALFRRVPARGRILEVGCGTGGFLVAAAEAGADVTGVEIASRWLVVARRRLSDHGLSTPLVIAQGEKLPWPDGSFDTLVADSVLEHLDDPAPALREWRRVLRPGGVLILWSPNRFAINRDPHLGLWGLGWLPRPWLEVYLRRIGRDEWPPRTLSARAACSLVRRHGFDDVGVNAPPVSAEWAATRPPHERRFLDRYNRLLGSVAGRALLRTVGPLWELSARAGRLL